MTTEPIYGSRFDPGNKHFELYKKAKELGTWDPAKLIEKVPIEKDRENWNAMTHDEKEEWSRLASFFIDGEQEVAQDAQGLIEMMGSPYLDHNPEKQAFMTSLAFEESKHTEWFSFYFNEIMSDMTPELGRGPRRGGLELPRTSACGVGDLFERQGDLVSRATQNSAGPTDIARCITNYNGSVEGVLARGGYTLKNRLMKEAPLPALNQAFQLISTDEGRHITSGMAILKELLEKERAGEPEYQGVDEAIWDQAVTDLPDIVDTAVFIIEDTGDPLNVDLDLVLDRAAELFVAQYNEQLELESFDMDVCQQALEDLTEQALAKVESGEYEETLKRHQERFDKINERVAADGGR